MKINKLFSNHELRKVITSSSKEVSSSEAVTRLLRSDKKDRLVPLFLDTLVKAGPKEETVSLAKSYVTLRVEEHLSKGTRRHSHELLALFLRKVAHKNNGSLESALRGEICSKADFIHKAQNSTKLKEIEKVIQKAAPGKDSEPLLCSEAAKYPDIAGAFPPYEHNRIGREKSGFFLNANLAKIEGSDYFVLASCPQRKELVGKYFDYILDRKIRVLVSMHQVSEVGAHSAFWSNEVLKDIALDGGWKIENTKTAIVKEGTKVSLPKDSSINVLALSEDERKKLLPRIVERTLLARRGTEERTITHFHYENWHDKTPCPDLNLLQTMLNRKDELIPSKEVFAINCKGGVGRTGLVAATDLCRQKIKEKADAPINVPLLLAKLKGERNGLSCSASLLNQLYRVLA